MPLSNTDKAARNADVRERYIPVRYRSLADGLIKKFCRKTTDGLFSFDQADKAKLTELSELISDIVRRECDVLRDRVFERYEHINPDRDTLDQADAPADVEDKSLRELAYVFDRAGFRPVERAVFQMALDTANISGVEVGVDFGSFDYVMMFERGRGKKEVATPGFMGLYDKMVSVDSITRLGIVLKMRGQPGVYVKMFKDIPLADLEAVLPGASIRMGFYDKIWLSTALIPALIAVGAVAFEKLTTGDQFSEGLEKILTGLAILAGSRAYQVYYTYSVLKDQAAGRLAKQLYYQQLDGNAGVVSLMLDMVAQQESKLALTAYLVLLRSEQPIGSLDQLDKQIEAFLTERFGKELNFDLPTAVVTLRRLGLLTSAEGQPPKVLGLEDGIAKLVAMATSRRNAGYYAEVAAAEGDAAAATLHKLSDPMLSLA